MQQLALGVGDLKRVLTNVKTRGTWGEVQLEMLLEQVLTVDQYAKNVETVPGSGAQGRVCVKTAGAGRWLAARVDADRCEVPQGAIRTAGRCGRTGRCGRRVASGARTGTGGARRSENHRRQIPVAAQHHRLRDPVPAHRRPVRGSDAPAGPGRRPAARAPGQHRRPADPVRLAQQPADGLRTLALEKRSSEVWQVLGAAKTEFGKFGEALSQPRPTLEKAARNIESAEVRSRQMARKLKSVEALPGETAALLLGAAAGDCARRRVGLALSCGAARCSLCRPGRPATWPRSAAWAPPAGYSVRPASSARPAAQGDSLGHRRCAAHCRHRPRGAVYCRRSAPVHPGRRRVLDKRGQRIADRHAAAQGVGIVPHGGAFLGPPTGTTPEGAAPPGFDSACRCLRHHRRRPAPGRPLAKYG